MKQTLLALVLLGVGALVPTAGAAETDFSGTWEAARTVKDERLYIVLGADGKAEVVEEYELPTPGKAARALQYLWQVGAERQRRRRHLRQCHGPVALRRAGAACAL